MMTGRVPKISIILPTYNGEMYIEAAIQSCLNQTVRDIELIIVDDASTDDTKEILKGIKGNSIKIIYHKTDKLRRRFKAIHLNCLL